MAKYYLDENGVRILVNAFDAKLSNKVDKSELAEYAKKSDLVNVDVDLTDYATKTYVDNKVENLEPYDDTEIRDLIDGIEAKTSGLYHFKGSVADLAALQAIVNPEVGDTYNLVDTGMNAAWTGTEWDEFGSVTDLSEYAKIEDIQAITRPELNAILYSGAKAVVNDQDSLTAMFNNEQAEVEVILNEDVVLDSFISIPANKSAVLKLNGNTITSSATGKNAGVIVDGDLTIEGGIVEALQGRAITVQEGGSLTINGADIISDYDCAVSVAGTGASVVVEDGNITAQEVPVLVTTGGSATINGGHLRGVDNFAIGGNGSSGQGDITVTINGGIIEGNIQSAGYTAAAIYWPNSGTLNINGGTIVSTGAGIVQRGGTINLNSGTVVTANGPEGFTGKVGDSRVVVGSYAVVYDKNSKYPAMDSMELNIAADVILTGTDGDIQVIPADATGINDNR